MTSIIIGKEGQQRFPIKNAGVSRQHARITIDNGVWVLEDLDSTNGTYIREDNGKFIRIDKLGISEDTVIRLGDDSLNGYAFMAHHVLEENPDNYRYEFRRLQEWREAFRTERERYQMAKRNKTLIQIAFSIAVLAVTFIPAIPSNIQMMILRIGLLIPPLFNFFVTGRNGMQKIYDRQQAVLTCPRCGRPLSDFEITKELCMACKAHS